MGRYKVATCTGYAMGAQEQATGRVLGLTASVLDTLSCHREVKRFRSEDRAPGHARKRRGHDGARRAAEEYAAQLNAAATG